MTFLPFGIQITRLVVNLGEEKEKRLMPFFCFHCAPCWLMVKIKHYSSEVLILVERFAEWLKERSHNVKISLSLFLSCWWKKDIHFIAEGAAHLAEKTPFKWLWKQQCACKSQRSLTYDWIRSVQRSRMVFVSNSTRIFSATGQPRMELRWES